MKGKGMLKGKGDASKVKKKPQLVNRRFHVSALLSSDNAGYDETS